MFRRLFIFIIFLLLSSCEDTNVGIMADAAYDAVTAVTLQDDDVFKLARQAAVVADSKNHLAPQGSSYDSRLQRLIANHPNRDGRSFDYRVYITEQVNAFAMADGTVRVNSGLMDLMTDQELLFVIGHEMGHVVKNHSHRKVMVAYGSSALRKALASQENEIGQLARSVIGSFAEQLTNAQFSQYEEQQADIYGVAFLEEMGIDRSAAVSALHKLANLARQHTFLSSHPDPEKRAELILAGAYDEKTTREDPSLPATLFDYLTKAVMLVITLLVGLVKWLFQLLFG